MRKILKYKDGSTYISGGIASIQPSGIEPIEEVDVTNMSDEEIEKIRNDKKLFDKLKKKV
jgi:hypothetical protein